jgi:hypothetical protein
VPRRVVTDRSSDPHDDLRHGFHVRPGRVEVHDAGAKQVAAADDGVGHECLAAALQPIDELAVQRAAQVRFSQSDPFEEVGFAGPAPNCMRRPRRRDAVACKRGVGGGDDARGRELSDRDVIRMSIGAIGPERDDDVRTHSPEAPGNGGDCLAWVRLIEAPIGGS